MGLRAGGGNELQPLVIAKGRSGNRSSEAMRQPDLCVALVVALLGPACSSDARDGLFGASGATGGTGADSGGATPGTSDGQMGDGEDADGGDDTSGSQAPKLDVGAADDGVGGDEGCQKVDFLFVVDNSGSMWDNQINLANSFGGFIETITETLSAKDYHILVTDSDAWTPVSTLTNLETACEVYPTCCFEFCGPSSTCSSFSGDTSYGACPTAPPPPTVCDGTEGAGRVLDHNVFDPQPCPVANGLRYMLDDQPDLLETFECVARAGIGGDWNERPVRAAISALSDELVGPGGCNEGFLRDDALLVVTIISDANPYSGHIDHAIPPETLYEGIVSAKGDNADAVVVLGLFDDGHVEGSPCIGAGNEHYEQFMAEFGDKGLYGSVCAPDYAPFFLDAVADIDAACDDFVPEG